MFKYVCRVRDALLEPPDPQAYKALFARILKHSTFIGLPHVLLCHGGYGTGKTRLLRGLQAYASSVGHPCTFFNVSQYDPTSHDLSKLLLVKMGEEYIRRCRGQELQAKLVGYVLSSLDAALDFARKGQGLLAFGATIAAALRKQRGLRDVVSEFTDPIDLLKAEFQKMVLHAGLFV